MLAAAGENLSRLKSPTLVLWGDQDPYIPAKFADAYGAALPDTTVEHLDGAGHWPWLDRPELIGRICSFLTDRP